MYSAHSRKFKNAIKNKKWQNFFPSGAPHICVFFDSDCCAMTSFLWNQHQTQNDATFCQHFVNILSIFHQHFVNILSTIPTKLCNLIAGSCRTYQRNGSHPVDCNILQGKKNSQSSWARGLTSCSCWIFFFWPDFGFCPMILNKRRPFKGLTRLGVISSVVGLYLLFIPLNTFFIKKLVLLFAEKSARLGFFDVLAGVEKIFAVLSQHYLRLVQ